MAITMLLFSTANIIIQMRTRAHNEGVCTYFSANPSLSRPDIVIRDNELAMKYLLI